MKKTGETEIDHFKSALESHNKKDYKTAIKEYKKTLAVQGLDKKTLVLLGNAYYMERDYSRSEESYKKALSIDPNYAKAHFNLGIIFEQNKKLVEASQAYKRAIELDKDFAEAHANLGDVYKETRDLDQAIIHYKKALDIDDTLESAREGLKYIPTYYLEKANKRELINESDAIVRRGIAFEKKGDLKGAAKEYTLALEKFSASPSALLLLNGLGMVGRGVEKNRSFLVLNTNVLLSALSPEVREFLGFKLGGIELGPKILERLFEELRKRAVNTEGRVKDLFDLSRQILFDDPEQMLAEAIEFEKKGEFDSAKKAFSVVVDQAPYLVHGHYLFGLFLEQNGFEEEALSRYKEASSHPLTYLNGRVLESTVELFSSRPAYSYLRELSFETILEEFHEITGIGDRVSLARFIRYNLTQAAEARLTYGFEKEESGEAGEALSAYEDAINIDPTNPISHYILGLAYESRGFEAKAMEEYEKTRGADFSGLEGSEDLSKIVEQYLGKTTKDGHRVGTILSRYFEIIADDPEHMLELLGFIEDMKIESISKIIKSYVNSDLILGSEGRVVRDVQDFGDGGGPGSEPGVDGEGAGGESETGDSDDLAGRVVQDERDFALDLDFEREKLKKSRAMSSVSFDLLWKYKTQRSIRCEASTSDGAFILAGSENGIVYLIDESASSPWRRETGASVVTVDISAEGRFGVYGNSQGRLELLDCAQEGRTLWEKDFGKAGITSVAVSKEAGTIAISTSNFEITVYNRKGDVKHTKTTEEIIKKLDITDEGDRIIAASGEALFEMMPAGGLKKLRAFKPRENIQSISISKSGEYITVGTRKGGVYLLDSEGRIIWTMDTLNPVYGVSVSSKGDVVAGLMNGALLLYSKEGEQVWKYQTGENIWDVDISKWGDRIVSGCGLVFGNIYLFTIE